MGILRVSLLGCVRVSHGENPLQTKLTHPMQGILAYLILYRHRTHPREILAEIFWGEKDQEHSHASLNTALWQLRNAMEPRGVSRGTYLVSNHPNEIGFNPNSPFWLDVQAFEEGTNPYLQSQPAELSEDCVNHLESAVTLYNADLLEGFYDDWVLREREYLRERYLSALACLMGFYRKGADYKKSLLYGQKILDMDPLREEVHRYLMQVYLEMGQKAKAVRQYEICRESLSRELRIEPMQETRNLYQELVSPTPHHRTQTHLEPSLDLSQALYQLRQTQAAFEQARDELAYSIQTVEKAIQHLGM